VKVKAIGQSDLGKSALGAVVAVLCGLLLWKTSPGEPWVNASYDYLFRFGWIRIKAGRIHAHSLHHPARN